VKEDSGADISKWSAIRVAKYLADFAESNGMMLRTPSPDWSGIDLMAVRIYNLCDIFEDASDIDVLKLYFEIHPTEVKSDFKSAFS
jgi:hypothetical protein